MNKILNAMGTVILMTGSAFSLAESWVPDFSVSTDATYDDNFLMNDSEQDSWIYSLKPEVSLIYVTPVIKSELEAKIAVKRYSEFEQFDSEDPSLNWKNSYKKERSTWTMDFGYSENSQRDVADQDTGQFDSNTLVETINVNPGVSFRVTEKDDIGISFSYIERDYDEEDFSDNDNQTVGLNWQHKIDEVLSTTVNLSDSQYSADRPNVFSNDTDYKKLNVGFIYKHSDSTDINGSVGYFQSDSQKKIISGPVLGVENTENTGLLLNLGMNYSQEKNDWSFHLSRGLYPSSQGEVEERDSAGLGFEHNFTSRSSSGLNISWSSTDSLTDNRDSLTVSPYYHYRMTEKLKLQTSYVFRSFDRQIDTKVESNRVKIGLRYSF